MTKKRTFVGIGGLAVVACALIAVAWTLQGNPTVVTKENFERIRNGMTPEEVHAVLGPGNRKSLPQPGGMRSFICAESWKAEDGAFIAVWYNIHPDDENPEWVVHFAQFQESQQTWADRVVRWVGNDH